MAENHRAGRNASQRIQGRDVGAVAEPGEQRGIEWGMVRTTVVISQRSPYEEYSRPAPRRQFHYKSLDLQAQNRYVTNNSLEIDKLGAA